MFLKLNHQKPDIYKFPPFVLEGYKLSKYLPGSEKFGMVSQLRRAALSVHLNIAERCSGKSPRERKRFYEVARGSVIEIDSALDISVDLNYLSKEKLAELGQLLVRTFQMISKMISYNANERPSASELL